LAHPSQQHQLARTQPSTQCIPNVLPTFGIEDDDSIEDSTERIKISQQQPSRPLDKAMAEILGPQVLSLVHTVSQSEGIPLSELLCKPSQDKYNEEYQWDPAELVNLPDDDPYEKTRQYTHMENGQSQSQQRKVSGQVIWYI